MADKTRTVKTTNVLRYVAIVAFAALLGAGGTGWLLLDKDPGKLVSLLQVVVIVLGIGEASNIGKRATFKKEAAEE